MDSEINLIEKGKTCFAHKDYEGAKRIFEEALSVNPDSQESYFELGKICYIQQRYVQAIEKFKKAIDLDPGYTNAHYLLAKTYKETNRYEESIAEFVRALELGYENADIHSELYAAYKSLNKFSIAAEELKKAFGNEDGKELYGPELEGLCRDQIRLIQSYNFEGRYSDALKETEEASKFIGVKTPMFQNMLQNEIEIAQRKVELSCKIRALTVTLTNKCNLACIMCKTRNKPWDLPEKHLKGIIEVFPYLERVMWQGGEVFLYPGFKDLLKEASRFPMRKIIATNGILIDREFAEIMVKSNVELTFSIDGATKEVYERIRQGASFEKVIESVKLINELRQSLNPKMETRLNVLVMRSNCQQIEQFLDFAKQYKFNTVFFNSTGNDFQNLNENIFCYSRDEEAISYINKIRARIADKARQYNIRLENWLPSSEFLDQAQGQGLARRDIGKSEDKPTEKDEKLFCHVPWQRLYIDCGGYVRPDCLCPTEKYVGNISENTPEEIWNTEKMKEYRSRIINNDFRNFCNPDCVFGRVAQKNLKFV
jgi:MoaA/NifB/PqqE/SkfB family radical SAM enzyme